MLIINLEHFSTNINIQGSHSTQGTPRVTFNTRKIMSLKKLDLSNTITSSSNTIVAERSSRKSESDCSYLSVHSDPAETSSMKTSKSDSALYVKDVSTKWSIVRWVYALTKYSALSTPSMNFNDFSIHTHPHYFTFHGQVFSHKSNSTIANV